MMKKTDERPAELMDVAELKPYSRNARTHSPEQVQQIVRSIEKWGWTAPILVDEKRTILAGHGRRLAALELKLKKVPVIVLSGMTTAEKRAYVLADNKIAENAGWDLDALRFEIGWLKDKEFDLDLTGFDGPDLRKLFAGIDQGSADADEVPDLPQDPVSRHGDVWICGAHRVMCGDSTDPAAVALLVGGEKATLLHSDPPYGMGKEADGVAGDNVYGAKLDAFQMQWWRAWRPHLTSNASAYIWGNAPELWSLWYSGGLAKSEPMTLRNELVWDKKSIAGMASPELGSFPIASERALFFQLGRFVFLVGQTKEDYWPGWEPLRAWLVAERKKAGWTPAKVGEICENHMAGHWFGKSQWAMISAANYAKLQEAAGGQAFTRAYADLHDEYRQALAIFKGEVRDPRRESFDAARPYFDNAHDIMRDVWEFPRVVGAERFGHATPKPVGMMDRCIRSASREGELVLEPFGGTGATLIGAEVCKRRCFTMELQPAYVDVIVARWQAFSGQTATRAADGAEFSHAVATEPVPAV